MSSNFSNLDPQQIQQLVFDPENKSNRVTVVGLDSVSLNADLSPVVNAVEKLGEKLTVEPNERLIIVKEPEILKVEVERIVEKEKIVHIDRILEQWSIKTIEIPVPVIETKFERIEVPVISVQTKSVMPMWAMVVIAVQSSVIISMIIANLIK